MQGLVVKILIFPRILNVNLTKLQRSILYQLQLASSTQAKQVTTCMSYSVGATSEMTCNGDYSGKTTMQKLYEKGWKFISNISGTNKFVLVFKK